MGSQGFFKPQQEAGVLWDTASQGRPEGTGEGEGLNHVTDHEGTAGDTI